MILKLAIHHCLLLGFAPDFALSLGLRPLRLSSLALRFDFIRALVTFFLCFLLNSLLGLRLSVAFLSGLPPGIRSLPVGLSADNKSRSILRSSKLTDFTRMRTLSPNR